MKHGQAVRLITDWEFKRFLKVRDLVTTLVITVLFGAGTPLVIDWLTDSTPEVVTVAQTAGAPLPDTQTFEFVSMEPAEATAALEGGDIGGIIDNSDPEAPLLRVQDQESWIPGLSELLAEVNLESRLSQSGVSPAEFQALLRPVDLQVELTEPDSASGANTAVVAIIAGAMMFIIFMGVGILFSVITGEKANRVTEQIISSVSPQAWIDGKILGTMLYMFVNLLTLALGSVIAITITGLRTGSGLPALPELGASPSVIITAILFALLGTALYYALLAAVAATVDDPNTSQRGPLLMLPGVFIGLSFLGLLGSVDNLGFRLLSYIPLTRPSSPPAWTWSLTWIRPRCSSPASASRCPPAWPSPCPPALKPRSAPAAAWHTNTGWR